MSQQYHYGGATILDAEYLECKAELAVMFSRPIGLKSPRDFVSMYAVPFATSCLQRLFIVPNLQTESFVSMVRNCIELHGLNLPKGPLHEAVETAVKGCLEREVEEASKAKLARERKAIYANAVAKCVMSAISCLYFTAAQMGLAYKPGRVSI